MWIYQPRIKLCFTRKSQLSGLIFSLVIFPLSLVSSSQAQLIPILPAGFNLQDAQQQGRQLTIDTIKTIRKLPEDFKTTRTPIIWLSCNPGGLEENSALFRVVLR